MDQCCVERLVRTGRAEISKAPSVIGPAKLTVNDSGSPRRSGCFSTDSSNVAAVTPPNGPTMLLYAGLVSPVDKPAVSGVNPTAASKGWGGATVSVIAELLVMESIRLYV